jgi:hypothetical protein
VYVLLSLLARRGSVGVKSGSGDEEAKGMVRIVFFE